MFGQKEQVNDLFEKYDVEFSHRALTNGLWLMGEDEGIRQRTIEMLLLHLTEKGHPFLYVSTGANEYVKMIEDIVTKKRNIRRYHPVKGEMSSVNSINLPSDFEHAKIVEVDLSQYSESDQKIVIERINLQIKKLLHDMYENFKKYQKRESLRGVIFIDEYDVKLFKVFSNMESFEIMKDFDIGFVFCVEKEFMEKKSNTHKDQIKQIPRFNFWQS